MEDGSWDGALVIVSSKKPLMNYVTACVSAFNAGNEKIKLRARGRSIGDAVDVVNLLRSGFVPTLRLEHIDVGSEEVEFNGSKRSVSYIEIDLSRA